MARSSIAARRRWLALAAGSLLLPALGRAEAAPPVLAYEAAASAMSLHIEINLPAPVVVPGVGDVTSLTQDISITSGSTAKEAATMTAVAKAVLGDGNVIALSDVIGLEAESRLDGASEASDAIVAEDLGVLDVGVGEIATSVTPDGAGTALTSAASSRLAHFAMGLAGVPELPVKADVCVPGLPLDCPSTGAASASAEDTDLVRLSVLTSETNVTRVGSMVTAKASAGVGGLSVLGGLVTLDAVTTESVSSANGITGGAASETLTTVAGLKVGDVVDLKVTPDGVEGTVLGNELPDVADDALQDVIDTINGVLATAGVRIIPGEVTSTVDPAGTRAESATEGLGIVVNPLKAVKPLVAVQLVPAGTAVRAAQVAQPDPPVVDPPPPAPRPEPMPRTGAELPAAVAAAAAVGSAGLVARRRRARA